MEWYLHYFLPAAAGDCYLPPRMAIAHWATNWHIRVFVAQIWATNYVHRSICRPTNQRKKTRAGLCESCLLALSGRGGPSLCLFLISNHCYSDRFSTLYFDTQYSDEQKRRHWFNPSPQLFSVSLPYSLCLLTKFRVSTRGSQGNQMHISNEWCP